MPHIFFDAAVLLLWLLHEEGVFDPIYDWWEDHFSTSEERDRYPRRKHDRDALDHLQRKHGHHRHHKKRSSLVEHRHRGRSKIEESSSASQYYVHHVHEGKHKHRRLKNSSMLEEEDRAARHHHRKRDQIHRR